MKASVWVGWVMSMISAAAALVRRSLMAAGVLFLIAALGVVNGNPGVLAGLRALLPEAAASIASTASAAIGLADDALPAEWDVAAEADAPEVVEEELDPGLRAALGYVARRYRVAEAGLVPVFTAVRQSARELHIDPLLILAVIGVESAYNPLAQSVAGAQGLMQVLPRYHLDKLPGIPEPAVFLDPAVNIHVGARALEEFIQRNGSIEDGLQQFAGAQSDPDRRYAVRVMAELQRLDAASRCGGI